jgi:hypothetical protein
MKTRILALILIAACIWTGIAFAADNTSGTWKVDTAKSKYSPGPAPKSSTIKIESVGDNMKVTIDTANTDGTMLHSEWVGKYDGKDYPVKGDPNTDMRSYTRVDDYTIQSTAKKAGKVTLTTKTVYAKDGKTRTGTQTGTNAQGQKVSNTIVSTKQ